MQYAKVRYALIDEWGSLFPIIGLLSAYVGGKICIKYISQ